MKLSTANQLAIGLMEKHGLIKEGWEFQFNNATRAFGTTYYKSKRIKLSKVLTELNVESHVKDTLLHEIAHALAGKEAKSHGKEWKDIAQMIGGTGNRTYSGEVNTPPRKVRTLYRGTCPNGHSILRYKRAKLSCSKCDKKWNPGYMFVWKEA